MIRQFELVERVQAYDPDADEDVLNRAYVYGLKKHGNQLRASGDPYFSHPVEVAGILAEMRLDTASIVTGLLHDTLEDTDATRDEIAGMFGEIIARLVDGVTKLSRLEIQSESTKEAENLRKLVLAMSSDIRVLLVKLADRLHNMRTLHHIKESARRKRIARETMDLYAPLASRIGMEKVKRELEELAFAELNPDGRASVLARQGYLRERGDKLVPQIEAELVKTLKEGGLEAQVSGREKTPYSIWRKMQTKNVSFEQLADIMAFRIIVADVAQCYQALGLLHGRYQVLPQRFKDYISVPKPNGYRSLHTGVIGPLGQRIEIQIRTEDMQDQAERGVASHWIYKQGGPSTDAPQYAWLRSLMDILDKAPNAEEFLEHTKLEMFQDQVFCFTPKGKLIALPRGATPIDFAYAVHTDIGNSTVGCRINGSVAPIVSELNNGDEVEIIRAENHVPPPAWESLVITGKARAAIRRATREAVRRQFAGLGQKIVERAFSRSGHTYAHDKLVAALPRLARHSVDDVMAAVGRGEMVSSDVVKAVYPDFKEDVAKVPAQENGKGWFELRNADNLKFKVPGSGVGAQPLPIRGLSGELPVRFAPNGGAVPGDRIIGILTPGEGITVYPIQSPALSAFDDQPDRWLDVRWDLDEASRGRFPAQIHLSVMNEPGSLAQITRVIGEADANIDSITMTNKSPDFREMRIDVEVWNLKHLNGIISELKTKPQVSSVERVNG